MIDHIKLAEGVGASCEDGVLMSFEEFQAYTNAILEHAAVKCDGQAIHMNADGNYVYGNDVGAVIRQEKV